MLVYGRESREPLGSFDSWEDGQRDGSRELVTSVDRLGGRDELVLGVFIWR